MEGKDVSSMLYLYSYCFLYVENAKIYFEKNNFSVFTPRCGVFTLLHVILPLSLSFMACILLAVIFTRSALVDINTKQITSQWKLIFVQNLVSSFSS